MRNRNHALITIAAVVGVLLSGVCTAAAQEVEIGFTKIAATDITDSADGYSFVPNVEWEVFSQTEAGFWTPVEVSEESYRLCLWPEDGTDTLTTNVDEPRKLFETHVGGVGATWNLYVQGWVKIGEGMQTVSSDTASFLIRPFDGPKVGRGDYGWFGLLAGLITPIVKVGPQIPRDAKLKDADGGFYSYLFMAKKAADNSTLGGDISFNIIRLCFWLAWFPLIRCVMRLRMWWIFPVLKRPRSIWRSIISRDGRYTQTVDPGFTAFLDKWEGAIRLMHTEVQAVFEKNNKNGVVSDEAQISQDVWYAKGRQAFAGVVAALGTVKQKYDCPTLDVMEAGLKNQVNNGMRWFAASEEVDRAIENRANEEIGKLKRWTHVEWLWHLAAVAPLAGLLGTVTGISFSFLELVNKGDSSAKSVIKQLAPSINEALWTTIIGLMVAILLIICHSFFTERISWISSKWEEMVVKVTEEL